MCLKVKMGEEDLLFHAYKPLCHNGAEDEWSQKFLEGDMIKRYYDVMVYKKVLNMEKENSKTGNY